MGVAIWAAGFPDVWGSNMYADRDHHKHCLGSEERQFLFLGRVGLYNVLVERKATIRA